MTARPLLRCLAAGLLAGGALAAAPGPAEVSALGAEGTVYVARSGPLAQLIAGEVGTQPILALEIRRPDAEPQRLVVPETGGEESESSPFLLVESSSEILYLIWQSRAAGEQATLKLASFDGERWGEVLEIRDNPQSAKGSPQVWVTRDTYRLDLPEGGTRAVGRAVVHVLWWEESLDGDQAFYKPLVLIDGAYAGSHPATLLNELDAGEHELDPPAVATALVRAPRLQTGRTDHSVLVSFANPLTDRMATVEVAVVSGELTALADGVRSHIIRTGAKAPGLEWFAEDVRSHVIRTGGRLHPGVLDFVADLVRSHIIRTGAVPAEELDGLAAAVAGLVVSAGAEMLDNGAGVAAPRFVTLQESAAGAAALPSNVLRFRLLNARPAPATAEAPSLINASPDGSSLLVAWRVGQQFRYREHRGGAWSPVAILELGPGLSAEQAARILERRVGR